MSDEQSNALVRLDKLVEEIESELADAESDISDSCLTDISDTTPDDVNQTDAVKTGKPVSGKVIDIAEHPLGQRSWLPDAVLSQAEQKFTGLTDEIWERLTQELNQVKPTSDNAPQSDINTSDDIKETAAEEPSAGETQDSGSSDSQEAVKNQPPADDADAQKLQDIQERIDRYWDKHRPKSNETARSLGMALSLGFIMAAVLYGSYLTGTELVKRSGQGWLLPFCLIAGAAAGFYIGFMLLHPLVKDGKEKHRPAPPASKERKS